MRRPSKTLWGLVFVPLAACASFACEGADSGEVRPAQVEVFPAPSDVLIPLPDGTVVVQQDLTLLRFDPLRLEREPEVVGPSEGVGAPRTAVWISGTAILVVTSDGSFVFRDDAWVRSRFTEALDGPIVTATMVPTPTGRGIGDLWVATASSLYRVTENPARMNESDHFNVERLGIDAMGAVDLSEAELAVASRPEGPSLWLRMPDGLLEVWRDRTGVTRAATINLASTPTAIGGDASGTGWLLLDGNLHSIGPERQLVDHGLAVDRIVSSVQSREAWFWGSDGALWLASDGRVLSVVGSAIAVDEPVALGGDGALYHSEETLQRHAPRHAVRVEGLESGAFIGSPASYQVMAEGSPTIEVTVSGVTLEPTEEEGYVVDPEVIGEGTHELTVRVSYDDGTLVTEERRQLEVITRATWTDDIEPLYRAHCATCHGEAGPANHRLDSIAGWSEGMLGDEPTFDVVRANITDGRMPLNRPPLSLREIAFVEAWGASGFPE